MKPQRYERLARIRCMSLLETHLGAKAVANTETIAATQTAGLFLRAPNPGASQSLRFNHRRGRMLLNRYCPDLKHYIALLTYTVTMPVETVTGFTFAKSLADVEVRMIPLSAIPKVPRPKRGETEVCTQRLTDESLRVASKRYERNGAFLWVPPGSTMDVYLGATEA